ncbi:MAG: enoyl-CoA hydratase/isomerase family protein [Actinomycetota bacterium]|nr:enoyl-CoA hydratase/isomerase family protein [Actinomycetota bacterium]
MESAVAGERSPFWDTFSAELLSVEHPLPHVLLVRLDNPPHNVLTVDMRRDLVSLVDHVENDFDVRAVVITGNGGTFTAGGDLSEETAHAEPDPGRFGRDGAEFLSRIENCRVPVIAAINGPTRGGGLELALSCDIRIASTRADFACSGVNVGLITNWWRLSRAIGLSRAKHVLLTGEKFTAAAALEWGMVTRVHEGAELLPAAIEIAGRIASRVPLSVEATKACANLAFDLTGPEADEEQVKAFLRTFNTRDHVEARTAFFERRPGEYIRG